MEKFTASNGVTVDTDVHGCVTVAGVESLRDSSQALREFFQHERDQELRRWRWPAEPHILVYETHTSVLVVDEVRPGRTPSLYTAEDVEGRHGQFAEAARAYFAAHPEPKPWHDAKPGEVWVVRVTDVDLVMTVHESNYGGLRFRLNDQEGTIYALDTPSIREGRRIWPESSDE